MKKWIKILLIVVICLGILVLIMPGYLRRALIYTNVGIDDYTIFENREIVASQPQELELHPFYNQLKWDNKYNDEFFSYGPIAFLILKDDCILLEDYYEEYGPESLSNSFSMAKSIVSLLIGIAIDEGKIKDVNQPVKDFLPDFEAAKSGELTIEHLLTMSSGLDWDEAYSSAFSITTKAYYGQDLEGLLKPLGLIEKPGVTNNYVSGNSQLLAMIINKATGKTVSEYASEKLWGPIGASHNALWSLDDKDGIEKAYCCFNSNARDFARLGLLVLNEGNWHGKQIISSEYINKATQAASWLKKPDGSPVDNYGYQFWTINHRGHQIPYFRGILGQYIFIIKDYNAVVVRLGNKRAKLRKNDIPIDILLYLDMSLDLLEQYEKNEQMSELSN